MKNTDGSRGRGARVVIAGGGFAALEAALALRALAAERVQLSLISPNQTFAYRPAATIEPFAHEAPTSYDLEKITADLGAAHHKSALEAVRARERWVRLDSGLKLDYDALILATGTRARIAVPGALTFRDQRDVPRFRKVLDALRSGAIRRLVFTVPSRDSWPLPMYELALLSAAYVARHSLEADIALVTPEEAPLELFGRDASRLVAELLGRREIRFAGDSLPHSVRRDGSLALQFDAPVRADQVIAAPELRGTRITGVPAGWSGFIPTDWQGRVEGLEHVYAAGDITTYPIKQGGIAAQQAELIAHSIAAGLGAPVKKLRQTRVLRARLLDGEGAVVLRTELDGLGRPTATTVEHRESRQAGELKVFGHYLTPYLAAHQTRIAAVA